MSSAETCCWDVARARRGRVTPATALSCCAPPPRLHARRVQEGRHDATATTLCALLQVPPMPGCTGVNVFLTSSDDSWCDVNEHTRAGMGSRTDIALGRSRGRPPPVAPTRRTRLGPVRAHRHSRPAMGLARRPRRRPRLASASPAATPGNVRGSAMRPGRATVARKSRQAVELIASVGPRGSLESRTRTSPPAAATSTHASWPL